MDLKYAAKIHQKRGNMCVCGQGSEFEIDVEKMKKKTVLGINSYW